MRINETSGVISRGNTFPRKNRKHLKILREVHRVTRKLNNLPIPGEIRHREKSRESSQIPRVERLRRFSVHSSRHPVYVDVSASRKIEATVLGSLLSLLALFSPQLPVP